MSEQGSKPTPSHGRSHGFRLLRLMRKELREVLRDRRTIGTLLLMPLLVYPILSITFQRFLISTMQPGGEVVYRVGVESEAAAAHVSRFLAMGDALLRQQVSDENAANADAASGPAARADGPAGESSHAAAPAADEPQLDWRTGRHLVESVEEGQLDLAIVIQPDGERPGRLPRFGPTLNARLVYRRGALSSEAALRFVEERMDAVNDLYLRRRLERLTTDVVLPAQLKRQAIEKETGSDFSLATFVPLMLILMTITGAVYPAIDLTAGERERGTLETLIAAPVPRMQLLLAKYVGVLTVALLTAAVNLAAMTLTIIFAGLGPILFGPTGLSWMTVLQVFALTILFACFFSAVLLVLTSFARSFKEAQTYLIPLMLAAIAPGLLSLMPNLSLSGLLAVTPLVNIVLLARDLLEQAPIRPLMAATAIVSTSLYALAAIAVAARVFGTDAVLYGSGGSWSDMVRRPTSRSAEASWATALLCAAVLLPLFFLAGNLLLWLRDVSVGLRLVMSAVILGLLFALLPLALAVYRRIQIRTAFALHAPGWLTVPAAVVLGFSVWTMAHEVFLLNRTLGLPWMTEAQLESARQLVEQWHTLHPLLILVTLALAPGIFEELFFRGFLFGALRARSRAGNAILLSALLFAFFHTVSPSMLTAERFLPSLFLGLILGWVRYRTASVLPCMILHTCHNGLLLMVAYYQDDLLQREWGVQQQEHLPPLWLAMGAAAAAVGILLMLLGSRRSAPPPAASEPVSTSRSDS